MRSQIRLTAAWEFLNPFTCLTPGRLFQMATGRSGAHVSARSASSFWLPNESNGVAVVAAASSLVANVVMLF